jgi:Zn-dependent membrane protease YugP
MHFILIAVIVAAIIFGPSLWAKRTFSRYSREIPDMPGTGSELARHLLDRFDMQQVKVEITQQGDHYDPAEKVVRLSPDNYKGKSLTAIAVAAHEVGHAIQDKQDSPLLHTRTRLIKTAQLAEKAGSVAMLAIPFVTAATRAPGTGILLFLVGFGSIFVSTLVHLVTLPVELDASFGKALPILKNGEYISAQHETAINKILKAAAFTYVAQSLASLLNLARWIAVLRRR